MAKQPLPSHPWLILCPMRPPAPAPLPAAASPTSDPRPQAQAQSPAPQPIFRPTYGQAFRPTTQPQQPPPSATGAPPFPVGSVLSVPSYPNHKTTPPSEKFKPPAPPPSPLSLPPAQVKFTPEPIVLMEKPKPSLKPSNGGLQKHVGDTAKLGVVPDYEKREQTKDMEAKDHKGNHTKVASEDNSMKIKTIAGGNKGAIMELSPASKKHDPQGNSNILIKTNPITLWDSKLGSDACGSHEEKSKNMDRIQNKMGDPSLPMNARAFMNSCVQAVNNSLLFNASCTNRDHDLDVDHDHDLGVRVFLSLLES